MTREWRNGDRVEIDLPMRTTIERLPDGSDYVAILHGPIVLAARTGEEHARWVDCRGRPHGARVARAVPAARQRADAGRRHLDDGRSLSVRYPAGH